LLREGGGTPPSAAKRRRLSTARHSAFDAGGASELATRRAPKLKTQEQSHSRRIEIREIDQTKPNHPVISRRLFSLLHFGATRPTGKRGANSARAAAPPAWNAGEVSPSICCEAGEGPREERNDITTNRSNKPIVGTISEVQNDGTKPNYRGNPCTFVESRGLAAPHLDRTSVAIQERPDAPAIISRMRERRNSRHRRGRSKRSEGPKLHRWWIRNAGTNPLRSTTCSDRK
jgi:hypothetical protein